MKAEEHKAIEKNIENNSLNDVLTKAKGYLLGRGGYYAVGTIALLIAVGLLWRYVAKNRTGQMDERVLSLEAATTPEQLKKTMDDNQGNMTGSIAKLQLARWHLGYSGLEKIGTDNNVARIAAAAEIEKARGYLLELTEELKGKDEPALLQEVWLNVAKAEEALVGFPKVEGGTDYRGNVDKAIEYYTKATEIFKDSEPTKRIKEKLDNLTKNKNSFEAFQKEVYKKPAPRPSSPFGTPDEKSPDSKATEPTPMPMVPTPKDVVPPPVPMGPDAKKDPTPPTPPTPPKNETVPDPKPK